LIQRLRWRRWWRERGQRQLRGLAIEHWDPLGVYDEPARADAYDAYLDRVGRMLRRGKGAPEIARYLGDVRTKAFKREESETVDELFADRIVAWYAVEAPDG
jgi:hypothetical protein